MKLLPGEVAATGWTVRPLRAVLDELLAAAGDPGRPVVVAIDGRGGAGKSLLAARLQAMIPDSAVVHTDDVAWHHSFFDWDDLLAEHVLEPVRAGRPVSYRPRAWDERGREGAVEVPAGTRVLLVEGTGVLRPSLAHLVDASLYVQGDLDEQDRRLAERDGDDDETRAFIDEWLSVEVPLLAQWQPWRRADVVVDATSTIPHAEHEVVYAPPVR